MYKKYMLFYGCISSLSYLQRVICLKRNIEHIRYRVYLYEQGIYVNRICDFLAFEFYGNQDVFWRYHQKLWRPLKQTFIISLISWSSKCYIQTTCRQWEFEHLLGRLFYIYSDAMVNDCLSNVQRVGTKKHI